MHSVLIRPFMIPILVLALSAPAGLLSQEAQKVEEPKPDSGKPVPAESASPAVEHIPVFELGEKGLVPAPKPAASFKDQGVRPDAEVTVVFGPSIISPAAALSALKELLGTRQSGPQGFTFGPDFRAAEVPGSRKLLLSGKAMRVEQALQILQTVDVPRPPEAGEPAFTVLALKHADASSIQQVLAGLFRQSDPSAPRVLVDSRTNTLILEAKLGQIDFIKKIVQQLDIPIEVHLISTVTRIVPIKVADANDVANLLQALKGAPGGGMRPGRPPMPYTAAPASSFRVVVDTRTNSLIIEAPEDEMEKLVELIGKLGVPASGRKEALPAPAEEGKPAPGVEKPAPRFQPGAGKK